MELHRLTIHELHEKLKRREVTSREITESVLNSIKKVDEKVKAFLTVTPEIALKQADEADRRRQSGEDYSLLGIPMAIKDVICTEGIRTTCGSKVLHNFVPPYDATVIKKLKAQGAVCVGKANMDEFAMGSSTENSRFFPTRNPWDLERIPGGSSGGSGAAVAADECIAALGSDTGGSVRLPAAFCGIVGLKPTYGRVSRFGLVAYASSLDQIGPLTKDVEDCAIVLNAIAGRDLSDSTSADIPVPDYTNALVDDVKGMRLGIPREYFIEGLHPDVDRSTREAIKLLESLGAVCEEVSLPHTDYAIPTYYLIATAEASSNLARYDGVKYGYRAEGARDLMEMYKKTRAEGFGTEVKRRIMLGTYALSAGYYDAYYKKAQQVRTLIKRDFEEAFKKVDVILTPVSPTPPFKLGEKMADPLQMYLSDIFTISVNLAGIPGISIPCGFSTEQLPIGLQILGKHFDEEKILRVAYTFERHTEYHHKRPGL
ncbi:MAG: Asp-tRNA(Asn)/Glu-tRNA(Gln) amidotransferase subunit GatA [Candidatus Tectomicrobia bacterium]|nr:Asp-tRNA(Asn)/Glu-tRNA(Gln) amidotransferase subunit GatA [Candidatus Tectomicrobia bacterium]